MACYLRAWGADFDVDAFVRASTLRSEDVWRRGEAKRIQRPGRPTHYEDSGLTLKVGASEALAGQVTEALAFLRQHGPEVDRLAKAAGIERVIFDFGLSWEPDSAAQFARLPPELLRLAGALNCWIEVSHYLA